VVHLLSEFGFTESGKISNHIWYLVQLTKQLLHR